MKKSVKVTLIILGFLIGIIILDILQVKIFSNSSIIKVTENYNDENKGEEKEKMENAKSINVIINNKKYSATIEDNETVKEFLNLLPQEFNMEELNKNEKYVYMNYSLTTNSTNPKHITAGDIMLYGNNCLVIFYKSFDTSYSYTKLGHIDNLEDLGDGNITVKFENN